MPKANIINLKNIRTRHQNNPSVEDQIAHINELTKVGRANWLGLLAYLSFSFITLLGVVDADFFIPERQTNLPIINVSIPTFSFFIFSPLLGSALYVYLHLHLRKVSEALTRPAAKINGQPLERYCSSWLMTDFILRQRRDFSSTSRHMDWLASITTVSLIWLAGPTVLFWFWVRSFPVHEPLFSAFVGACLSISVYAGFSSWTKMKADLRGRQNGTFKIAFKNITLIVSLLIVSGFTLLKTIGGLPTILNKFALDSLDVSFVRLFEFEGDFSPLPTWLTTDNLLSNAQLDGIVFSSFNQVLENLYDSRKDVRRKWCISEGLSQGDCSAIIGFSPKWNYTTSTGQKKWCAIQGYNQVEHCSSEIQKRQKSFSSHWRNWRDRRLNSHKHLNLQGVDLRGASLRNANISGVDFTKANLSNADLSGVSAEFAKFSESRLINTQLGSSNLYGAIFDTADLHGAFMNNSNLEETYFVDSNMDFASLQNANLYRSDLSQSSMKGADFSESTLVNVKFSRSNLSGAVLVESNASRANFSFANLDNAVIVEANLEFADFSEASAIGANFSFSKLSNAFLNGVDFSLSEMNYTDLSGSSFIQAIFFQASLEGAKLRFSDLSQASFNMANLSHAQFEHAVLLGADFRETQWHEASLFSTAVYDADFRGATGLTQRMLNNTVGNETTLLPWRPTSDFPEYYVFSCWETPPKHFGQIVEVHAFSIYDYRTVEDIINDFLCDNKTNPHIKTGSIRKLDVGDEEPPMRPRIRERSGLDLETNSASLHFPSVAQTPDLQSLPSEKGISATPLEQGNFEPYTDLIFPVQGTVVRQYAKEFNEGIDIQTYPLASILAASSGTVAAITSDAQNHPILVLRHTKGMVTVYANIGDILVSKGESVQRGQVIATMPEKNAAVLHFEVRVGFDNLDPLLYLE